MEDGEEADGIHAVDDNAEISIAASPGEEFPVPQHTFIRIGETWLKGLSNEGA
jgi:hypothetical protein